MQKTRKTTCSHFTYPNYICINNW